MSRFIILIFLILICSCKPDNKSKGKTKELEIKNDYTLIAKFTSFDTTVEVLFWDTKDSISDTQKKNYEGFISSQDSLTPDILQYIFDFYKSSYPDYREGWTMGGKISEKELEKYLPVPTTPENLKSFITPAIIHIQNKQDCKEGTIGIEFDCTWDIENGLGVLIENWKPVRASLAEIAYFLKKP